MINNDLNLIYIPIPKNGSSLIRSILNLTQNFSRIKLNKESSIENVRHICNLKHIYNLRNKGIYRYLETSDELKQNQIENCDIEQWNLCKKFSFIRNPYDKFASSFCFFKKMFERNNNSKINQSFNNIHNLNDLIENKENISDLIYCHTFITQFEHIVSEDGDIKIDNLGKVENLIEDLFKILLINKKNNEPVFIEDLCNSEFYNMSNKKKYYEYYDEKTLNWVNEYFKKDFETFEYKICNTIEELKEENEKNEINLETIQQKKEYLLEKYKNVVFYDYL